MSMSLITLMTNNTDECSVSNQWQFFLIQNTINRLGEISGSHGGQYKDDDLPGMLRRVVW
jgi:hypothetical protein